MHWFDGTVEGSIKKALNENKIFIVYIEGENDESKRMIKTWNDKDVVNCCSPDKCVAIKIKAGSVECEQFSQCYPVLCIPSTYMINQSGIPADIIPGYLDTVAFVTKVSDTLKEQLDKASGNRQVVSPRECSLEVEGGKEKGKNFSKGDEDYACEAIQLKIEQDKAEKKAEYEKSKENEKKQRMTKRKENETGEKVKVERSKTRIQFRFPNGSTTTNEFSTDAKLSDLINAIKQVHGYEKSNISLATVYPRRQFQEYEMASTLLEVNLVPNAALFVIEHEMAHQTSSKNSILDFIKFVLAPILALFMYIKLLLFSEKEESSDHSSSLAEENRKYQNDAKYMTKSTTYKKDGKIYKFKQGDDDDEDKEKKTWNGNSTQQM